jgi:uncharacterized repeat protein (TIGR01451 family)
MSVIVGGKNVISGTTQRRFRWLAGLGLALTAGAVIMSAGSANASTPPPDYVGVGTWSSGSVMTAALPSPYAGTVTLAGGTGQTATGGTEATLTPTNVSDLTGCLNGHSGTNGEDNVANCTTYTATMTFSTPVQNPIISLDLLGGAWKTGTAPNYGACTTDWTNVTFAAVNGAAPSGLTLAAPLDDSRAAWNGTTLSVKDSAVQQCEPIGVDYQQIKVPGTVTSISFTYTVRAETSLYDGTQLGMSSGPGVVTDVYLAPPTTDLAIDKTVTTVPAAVGDPIAYSITVTNNGPDTALAYLVVDQLPAGITGATTTTPGCGIANGGLSCIGNNLASGASRTITLTGTATTTGTIANTATVSTSGNDTNSANDTDTATVTVVPTPVASPWMAAGLVGLVGIGVVVRRVRSARAESR